MPHLAALVCHSLFDLAISMRSASSSADPCSTRWTKISFSDLAQIFDDDPAFVGKRLPQFLKPRRRHFTVWHLVGGLDPLDADELTGREPRDGYPILLRDWIRPMASSVSRSSCAGMMRFGITNASVRVGTIAIEEGCDWLTADFNCTVTDPAYVCEISIACSLNTRASTG
jgi:hypothetical protein